jgi:hypothetical protein
MSFLHPTRLHGAIGVCLAGRILLVGCEYHYGYSLRPNRMTGFEAKGRQYLMPFGGMAPSLYLSPGFQRSVTVQKARMAIDHVGDCVYQNLLVKRTGVEVVDGAAEFPWETLGLCTDFAHYD